MVARAANRDAIRILTKSAIFTRALGHTTYAVNYFASGDKDSATLRECRVSSASIKRAAKCAAGLFRPPSDHVKDAGGGTTAALHILCLRATCLTDRSLN